MGDVKKLDSFYTPKEIYKKCIENHPNATSTMIVGVDEDGSQFMISSNMSQQERCFLKCYLDSYINVWFNEATQEPIKDD